MTTDPMLRTTIAQLTEEDVPTPPPPPTPLELKAEENPPPQDNPGEIPSWAQPYIPEDMRIPRGKQVYFVRFRSALTDAPHLGVKTTYKVREPGNEKLVDEEVLSRVIIVWPLSDLEEKQALKRMRNEPGNSLAEYAKQMIRAVDGKLVDWTGEWAKNPGLYNVQILWGELGTKCRTRLKDMYVRLHNMTDEEMADFLLNGIASASAVAG